MTRSRSICLAGKSLRRGTEIKHSPGARSAACGPYRTASPKFHGMKGVGVQLPDTQVGSWHDNGRVTFAACHGRGPGIVIDLANSKYDKVVLTVENPEDIAAPPVRATELALRQPAFTLQHRRVAAAQPVHRPSSRQRPRRRRAQRPAWAGDRYGDLHGPSSTQNCRLPDNRWRLFPERHIAELNKDQKLRSGNASVRRRSLPMPQKEIDHDRTR